MASRNRLVADNMQRRSWAARIASSIRRIWDALELLEMITSGVFWIVLAIAVWIGGIVYLIRKAYERST